MTVLAFDGRTGASGDMLLAALLDAGADADALAPVEDAFDLEYAVGTTVKCGIEATSVDVYLTDETDGVPEGATVDHSPDDEERDHAHHDHDHGDDHAHDDCGDDHVHGDDHDPAHAEGHGPRRSYPEVRDLVVGMDLPASVEAAALATFERLGEAEAAVHGTDLETTHFHEVGADDAIADVVGAALLIDDLDVDRVVTPPLSAGGGTVSMSHGEYPVPGPAVVEIAERADWALRGGPVDRELLTPTGAAILAHHAEGVDSLPSLDVESSGYGAGGYDLDPHPNVLRALVGEPGDDALVRDEIAVLETNVDDAPPEVLGGLQETLADAGARDVSVLPATMKKSRPGHLVKVICKPEDRQRVARKLAEETGTLGIREVGATHRWIAERSFETATVTVDGEPHEVTVKVASDAAGEVYDASVEYDDALAVARETDLPIREIARRAEREALDGSES